MNTEEAKKRRRAAASADGGGDDGDNDEKLVEEMADEEEKREKEETAAATTPTGIDKPGAPSSTFVPAKRKASDGNDNDNDGKKEDENAATSSSSSITNKSKKKPKQESSSSQGSSDRLPVGAKQQLQQQQQQQQQQEQDLLLQEGDLRKILHDDLSSTDPNAIASVLEKLAQLCSRNNNNSKQHSLLIGKLDGGMIVLRYVLKHHPDHAKIQAQGCHFLMNWMRGGGGSGGGGDANKSNIQKAKETVFRLGGIAAILKAMLTFPKDTLLLQYALGALASYVTFDHTPTPQYFEKERFLEQIAEWNAIATMVSAMKAHHDHVLLQQHACEALSRLCDCDCVAEKGGEEQEKGEGKEEQTEDSNKSSNEKHDYYYRSLVRQAGGFVAAAMALEQHGDSNEVINRYASNVIESLLDLMIMTRKMRSKKDDSGTGSSSSKKEEK